MKQNPAHQWDDVEGVHYHYPSKYRRKIQSGEPFVYYRGVHRADGRRAPAEYFGAGRIGAIWKDPDRPNGWYCAIDDYQRFATPVPAKVDGVNREIIPANLWRDGVRDLDPAVYAAITVEAELASSAGASAAVLSAAPLTIEASSTLIVPPKFVATAGVGVGHGGRRRSARAKAIGDWAERAALTYIQDQIADCSDCVHRAGQGETPGWDIDYRDSAGELQRVEVKGTVGAGFTGVELTANEMAAAEAHGDAYWLCLVANCETSHPKVQMIQNPAAKLAAGDWSVNPSVFDIQFAAEARKDNGWL